MEIDSDVYYMMMMMMMNNKKLKHCGLNKKQEIETLWSKLAASLSLSSLCSTYIVVGGVVE